MSHEDDDGNWIITLICLPSMLMTWTIEDAGRRKMLDELQNLNLKAWEQSSSTLNIFTISLKVGIRTGLMLFLEPMEKESVKKMMLKQEEIFKQQVRELHRLYQAQKQLMAEFKSYEGTSGSFYLDDRHQSISQLSSESSLRNQHETWENDPLGKRKGFFDLEQPVVETSHEGVANVKAASLRRHLTKRTTMEGPEIDIDVELSLSIGCGAGKKKPKHGLHLESEMGCLISGPSETKQPTSITPVGPRRRGEGSDLPWSSKEGCFQGPRRDFRAL